MYYILYTTHIYCLAKQSYLLVVIEKGIQLSCKYCIKYKIKLGNKI